MAEAAAGWIGAAAGGALLALLYFGGLWWTVRRVPSSRHPLALVGTSLLVRAMLAVAVLLLIMAGDVVRLLFAVGGFILVRTVLVWRVRTSTRLPVAGAGD